jgi:thioesterase domain-containing protein
LRMHWQKIDGFSATIDAELVGEEGRVVAEARGLELRALDPIETLRRVGRDPLENACYDVDWIEQAPPAPMSVRSAGKRRWLVLADEGGVGAMVATRLEATGDSCTLLRESELERRSGRLETLLAAGRSFAGVIHLWGLDSPSNGALTPSLLESSRRASADTLIHLAGLLSLQARVPRLWLVTRGAQAVADEPVSIAQAPLWGLGRTIAVERPDMWGGMIDLDLLPSNEDAARIAQAITLPGGEDQVAYRKTKRHVARLVRVRPPAPGKLEVRPDRTYVVECIEGAVGLPIVRWLVDRGARRVVVAGLRPADEAAHRETIDRIAAEGVSIEFAFIDPNDPEATDALFEDAARPLAGVVIAHGMDRNPLRLTSPGAVEAFRTSFRVKAVSAWALYEATLHVDLDFFLVISSAASIWGWEGFGSHAAAGQLFDALVRHRRHEGSKASSVHWAFSPAASGASSEMGLAFSAAGLYAMPSALSLEAAERAAVLGLAGITAAWVDFGLFAPAHERRAHRRFLSQVAGPRIEQGGAAVMRARIQQASPDDAKQMVVELVSRHIAGALGTPAESLRDSSEALSALGIDSVMGIQLLTSLGRAMELTIPVAAMLEQRSIDALSDYILGRLGVRGDDPARQGSGESFAPLMPLRTTGSQPPFFCVHPLHGSALVFAQLASHLGDDQPFYGLNARGVDGDEPPYDHVEAMAGRYLEAIREVKPNGPYRLGGYSFGALVAFEMARQLRAAGEVVDALMLIDLPVLTGPKGTRPTPALVAKFFGFAMDDAQLARQTREEQARYVARSFGDLVMLPPDIAESEHQLSVYRAHLEALCSYVPRMYEGPVTLIRAHQSITDVGRLGLFNQDPTHGWGSVSAEAVRVHDVPGNHFSMLFEPHVEELARVLRRALA